MLILALDTTTRAGSLALVRDGRLLEVAEGDPGQTHAARLPGAILDCLARHHLTLGDLDLYGVAVGPGSFTGLRIGIATIQGLAFAHGRQVVGVSALDALAEAGGPPVAPGGAGLALRAAWMDARREEVYARLYQFAGATWEPMGEPLVDRPSGVLAAWLGPAADAVVEFIGDGVVARRDDLTARARRPGSRADSGSGAGPGHRVDRRPRGSRRTSRCRRAPSGPSTFAGRTWSWRANAEHGGWPDERDAIGVRRVRARRAGDGWSSTRLDGQDARGIQTWTRCWQVETASFSNPWTRDMFLTELAERQRVLRLRSQDARAPCGGVLHDLDRG